MDDRLTNAEWLRAAYETRSVQSIADELGVSRGTVRNRMVTLGIERRGRTEHFKGQSKPPEQRAKMSQARSDYWEQHPDREAFKLKISKAKQRNGSADGRTRRFVPGRGRIKLHRYAGEQLSGRPLRSDEHVHHKDHNPRNNDPSNLEILTPSEHGRLHYQERAPEGSGGLAREWRARNGLKRDSKGRFAK